MATYIPGVQDYIPQLETFTPDYKFLSDVLQTRQDRYDTNYNQINNLYGKVVYADLSRQDTKDKRDQYAELLAPRLHQVSGLDLSLQQNVDSAKALFKPFYDDDLVVKDLVNTYTYRDQLKQAEYYKKSHDKELRDKYWDDGVKYLNYQMDDFMNASPEEALQMNAPQYVNDPDLYEKGIKVLQDLDMHIEGTTLEGDWVIKQKDGSLLTRQFVKFDEETGDPIYINPAAEAIKRELMDDPEVLDGYYVKGYNKQREYTDGKIQQGYTKDQAQSEWANNIINGLSIKEKKDFENLEKITQKTAVQAESWEEYKKQYGIIKGSDQDNQYQKTLFEYSLLENTRQKDKARLIENSKPIEGTDDLLNRAYNMLMANGMQDDMVAAASTYSNLSAERTMEANPFRVKYHDYIYKTKLKALDYSYKLDYLGHETEAKDWLNRRKAVYEAEADGEQSIQGLDFLSGVTVTQEDGTELYTTNEDGELVADAQWIQSNNEGVGDYVKDIQTDKANIVNNYLQLKTASLGGNVTDVNVNGKKMSLNKAYEYLLDPKNSDELDEMFNEVHDEIITGEWNKSFPALGDIDDGVTLINLQTALTQTRKKQNHLEEGMDIMKELYPKYWKEMLNTEWADAEQKNIVNKGPSLFQSSAIADYMAKGLTFNEAKQALEDNKEGLVATLVENYDMTREEAFQYLSSNEPIVPTGDLTFNGVPITDFDNLNEEAGTVEYMVDDDFPVVVKVTPDEIKDYKEKKKAASVVNRSVVTTKAVPYKGGSQVHGTSGKYKNIALRETKGTRASNAEDLYLEVQKEELGTRMLSKDDYFNLYKTMLQDEVNHMNNLMVKHNAAVDSYVDETGRIPSYRDFPLRWDSYDLANSKYYDLTYGKSWYKGMIDVSGQSGYNETPEQLGIDDKHSIRAGGQSEAQKQRIRNDASAKVYYPENMKFSMVDDATLRAMSDKVYDQQVGNLNDYLNHMGAGTEGGPDLINIKAWMQGRDQTGMGVTDFSTYNVNYDHQTKDPAAVDQIRNIYDALSLPSSEGVVIKFGDARTNFSPADDGNDASAAVVMNLLKGELQTKYGKNDDRAARPTFQIAYAETLGGKEAKGNYAGYVIQFGENFADRLKATSEDPANNLFEKGEWKDNSLTIFVPKNHDNNPYKSENQKFSNVATTVLKEGEYGKNIPGSGGYRIYKDPASNAWMRQIWTEGYDPKTGNMVKDQMIPPQIITIDQKQIEINQLDGYASVLEKQLADILYQNMASMKNHKKSVGAKN
tara:strand:+ start:153 stop:3935 length:3783 start_codon:yes stop_codon:yes gene_type:complete